MKKLTSSLLCILAILMATGTLLLPARASLAQTKALVRIVHASPDTPAVDVYVNGGTTPLATNLTFFTATDFLAVDPLTVTSVQFRVAGSPPGNAPDKAFTGLSIALEGGKSYTLAAAGLFAGLKLLPFTDEGLTRPAAGKAAVRVFHLSPDAPPVGVRVKGSTTPLLNNLAFEQRSNKLELDAGIYDLEVFAAAAPTGNPALSLPGTVLQAGYFYDIFAVGQLLFTPPTLRVEFDTFTFDARVRVMHAAPTTGAVDIYLNNSSTPALTGVPFFTVSDYLDLPVSTSSVQVRLAGSAATSTPALSTSVALEAGKAYTLGAIGISGNAGAPLTLKPFADNLSAPAASKAKLRAFHLNPGVPVPVGIRVKGSTTPLIDNLTYGNASNYVEVDANAPVTLEVFGSSLSITLTNAQLKPGLIYDIQVVGETQASLRLESKLTDTSAKLRLAHASPDTGAVDIYLDGATTPVVANVPYYTLSDYLSIPAGSRSVQIKLAGQSALALQATLMAEAGKAYTLIARGLATTTPATLGLSLVNDDLSMPPAAQAKVRVFHLSPDAPAVDVRLRGATTPLINDLAFLANSGYLNLPIGSYDLEVTTADGSTVVTSIPDVILEPGKIYDIFATGRLTPPQGTTGQGFQIRSRVIDTMARVRLIHAAPNVGAVDVYLNGRLLAENLRFFGTSLYLSVPAGLGAFEVFPADTNLNQPTRPTPTLIGFFTVEAGKAYSIAARGVAPSGLATELSAELEATLAQSPLSIGIYEDTLAAPASGKAKVRVYHLSPNAPAVDVRVKGTTTPLVNDLTFPNASSIIEVDAGTYSLEITDATGATVVTTLENVVLQPGLIYNVYATNLLANLKVQTQIVYPEDAIGASFKIFLPIVYRPAA